MAATGTWPNAGSARATTTASATAGWSRRTASTSMGEMFSPPRTIRSVRRSATISLPSASSRPRSPVSQPAVIGPGRGRRERVAEIPAEQRRAGDLDLTDALGVRPGDAERDARQRPPGCVRVDRRLVGRRRGHARAGLGQAVRRHDRPAGRDGAPDEGRRDRAATEGHGPERRRRSDVPTEVEQAGQDGRHERDVARMGSGAQRRQDGHGVRARQHDQRHARQGGAPDHAQPGDMRQADRQEPAGRLGKRRQPRLGAGHQRGRREDDRLRPAGRPRGEDDDRGRRGVRRWQRAAGRARRACPIAGTGRSDRRAIAVARRASAPSPRATGRG